MPALSARTAQHVARLRFFAPALFPVAVAALVDHPGALFLLLLAQPLYLAGAVAFLGHALDADAPTLALRRGVPFLLLLSAYALLVALLVATPLVWIAREASALNAFALSVGVLLSIVAPARWWPAFGLVFLWDEAYPESAPGSWIIAAVRLSLAFGRRLVRERDPWFAAGLPVALGLLAVIAGAMGLTGLAGTLPSELRVGAMWIWALLLCPAAYLLLAHRCERLLLEGAESPEDQDPAAAKALAVAAAPAEAAPSADPAARDARVLAAAAGNQVELALQLLRGGARPDALPGPYDRDQRSLAIIAATAPDLRLLRELIRRGADINRAVAGLTPLLAATRDSWSGRLDTVMMLVTNGADPRAADPEGNTPLHYAALSRDPGVAAVLLDAGADPAATNREGRTPLGMACAAGNETLLRFLLERGAPAEVPRAVPALIAACSGADDQPGLVRILVRHKAAVAATDRLGRTALHAAALHGHAEMADALLAAGAPIDARDAHGVTATMEAARAGANRVLQRLMFRKPAVDLVDPAGRSALMIACASGKANEETVRLLLALGADPAIAAVDGRRAIDHAVAAGRWPLVALLDPEFPLPNALQDERDADAEVLAIGTERVALLAAALHHGRFGMADELLRAAPPLAPAECADAFLRLAAAGAGRAALDWLLARGMPVDGAGGAPPLFALAARRPLPLLALTALVDAGAPTGGGNLLADLLGDGDVTTEALEPLALALLERGANPGARDARGYPLPMLAAQRGAQRLLGQLLARGIDPNAADPRGHTALHALAAQPEATAAPLVMALLASGADPERPAADGQTPLGAALAAGRGGLARWLSWGDGFRHPGRALRGPDLAAAAKVGDQAAVERLLALGLHFDARDAQGCTALLRACGGGHLALVADLLDRGADPALAAETGATALSAAISARRESVVRLLLERGVDPNTRLPGGITPLMVACALGAPPIARALLAHGAESAAIDDADHSALHAAAQFAFATPDAERARELLRALLDAGTPADGRNRAGQTPLLLLLGARAPAATPSPQRALPDLLRPLVAAGANLAAQDERGVSVLHAAAMHGLLDAAHALLRAGADPTLVDRLGRTAHEVALRLGFADVGGELRRAAGRHGGLQAPPGRGG
ncbi:MAG: ankyrin repeat domain-containing protein [Pseudomonadota bacterium]